MPKKRRVKLRTRAPHWDDVGMDELTSFWCGWRVPKTDLERERSAWQTWEEFLGAWALVREEGIAEWKASRSEGLPFAEVAYQRVLAGKAPDGGEVEEEPWASGRR
jgi:hypothetical protein